ncbi:MAG TPA: ferredoxin family protein [Chloroflexota bacterium]|nr:ferredoxin family protein [Chloroflexota bacterium]
MTRTLGRVAIDRERCKGCGLCVEACPRGALRLSTELNAGGYRPAELPSEAAVRCTGCAVCGLVCPDVAIVVYRQRGDSIVAFSGSPALVGGG